MNIAVTVNSTDYEKQVFKVQSSRCLEIRKLQDHDDGEITRSYREKSRDQAGESVTKSHHAGENHTNHALTNDYTITARIYKPESCCFRVKKGTALIYLEAVITK